MATRYRTFPIIVTLLALILLGTVIVLSTVSYYLAIDPAAYLTEREVPPNANWVNSSDLRIPRILHQTWKTEELPGRWKDVSDTCRLLMPDYEYMLWTDASSRQFIKRHYAWFLETFDGYRYPIQRADAIRYFVLHHYGGIYLDMDVGCLRSLDPLLKYSVILPKTIPVGVSNDLMFSAKGHPFMEQTIHNLPSFDHDYYLNYPTVMFSTGPMYVSAQYGLYLASHPHRKPEDDVRVLPKALYGKNAKPGEAPHAFFMHHYGSSWHADDAVYLLFLGKWGRLLIRVGLIVVAVYSVRYAFKRKARASRTLGRRLAFSTRVDLLLPRGMVDGRPSHHGGRNRGHGSLDGMLDFTSFFSSSSSSSFNARRTSSDAETDPATPSTDDSTPTSPITRLELPLLPLPFDLRPSSPTPSATSNAGSDATDATERPVNAVVSDALRWAGSWVVNAAPEYLWRSSSRPRRPMTRRRRDTEGGRQLSLDGLDLGGSNATASNGSLAPPISRSHSHNHPHAHSHPHRAPSRRASTAGSRSFITLVPAILTSPPVSSSSAQGSSSSSSSNPASAASNNISSSATLNDTTTTARSNSTSRSSSMNGSGVSGPGGASTGAHKRRLSSADAKAIEAGFSLPPVLAESPSPILEAPDESFGSSLATGGGVGVGGGGGDGEGFRDYEADLSYFTRRQPVGSGGEASPRSAPATRTSFRSHTWGQQHHHHQLHHLQHQHHPLHHQHHQQQQHGGARTASPANVPEGLLIDGLDRPVENNRGDGVGDGDDDDGSRTVVGEPSEDQVPPPPYDRNPLVPHPSRTH